VGVRGRRRRHCREDCLPNAFDVSQHVVIPETEHAIAMFDQPLITARVASALCVLAAVHLDDEPLLPTNEIDDVRTDRLLTHELESAKRTRTKITPELAFCGRRILPLSSSRPRLRYVRAPHCRGPLTLTLSPLAGRGD